MAALAWRCARVFALVVFALLTAVLGSMPTAFAAGGRPSGVPVSHSAWSSLLRQHVRPSPDGVNRVDYARWKATGMTRLRGYIAMLERAAPSQMASRAQMAFWINLYNAKTAEIVLARYPVASIKDINLPAPDGKPAEGPWKAHVLVVEGKALSLDDVENAILRPRFNDARIHYALNCLSIGCPNLLPEAYEPERLDRQLDRAATAFVNHPRGITIRPDRIAASSIYDWFKDDFGGARGVLAHMSRYAKPELRRRLALIERIDAFDYDWRLNDIAAMGR